jgi:hypothetical protein
MSLFSLARAFLGKSYVALDLSVISTRLPSQLPDEAFTATGDLNFTPAAESTSHDMNSVVTLHSITTVVGKISRLLAGRRRPSPIEVLGLHDELDAISVSHAPVRGSSSSVLLTESLSTVLLSFAYVRLHRSCLGVEGFGGANSEVWHREACLQHSRESERPLATFMNHTDEPVRQTRSFARLTRFKRGDRPRTSLLPSLPSMLRSPSLSTCWVRLLGRWTRRHADPSPTDSPYSPSTDDTRSRLSSLVSLLESTAWPSSLARVMKRGATILRHLTVEEEQRTSSVPIAGPFIGMGHSWSGSSSSSSFDTALVDTPPSFLLPGQLSVRPSSSVREAFS